LAGLRTHASVGLIALLWLHVPLMVVIGLAAGQGWVWPTAFGALLAAAATIGWPSRSDRVGLRLTVAVALVARSR